MIVIVKPTDPRTQAIEVHPGNPAIIHWGHSCTLQEDGTLIADVPDEMLPTELAAGHVELIQVQG